MAYNERQNKKQQEYVREHMKIVKIMFRKEYYDDVVEKAIRRSGMPVATFVKRAVEEKIARDGLLSDEEGE